MDTAQSVFWEDLASDLQDPEFLREYVAESITEEARKPVSDTSWAKSTVTG